MEKDPENRPKKRPFITVKESIVAVLVIILVSVAFEEPFSITEINTTPLKNVSEQETLGFTKQIVVISASQIVKNIETTDNKPTLMVMYASWCGYCRKLLPNIVALKNEGKIDGVNLLLLSVDKDVMKFSTYFLQRNYDKVFTPYVIEAEEERALKNIIIGKGGFYSKSIPYSVIFDSKGNLIEEIHGAISKKILLRKLDYAINQPQKK